MIKILRADLTNPKHADALVALLSRYAQDPMGGNEELSDFTKANLAQEILKRTDTTVTLAFEDGKPVGIINCIEGFSTFNCKPLINIHDVYVGSECRGRGVATMLLDAAKELAIEKGCCKVTLECLEGNDPAIAAYSKYGFKAYELDPKMGKAMFMEMKL